MKAVILLLTVLTLVGADIYLHNPRGSNNRLDGAGREVANNKRLFDSQNNDRGGYLVGNMYYVSGSYLDIEWTNQHSCGTENNNCNIVIQYTCSPDVRDGSTRQTNKLFSRQCINNNCRTDTTYGMHEDRTYYLRCRTRQQNSGLFTADQELNGKDARFTRQNPTGTRRGYECPEERDYYPYWHPTPWRDIAILTNDTSRCDYYRRESENMKGRGQCVLPDSTLFTYFNNRRIKMPNNKAECEKFTFPVTQERAVWVVTPSHGIPPPECVQAPWSRDNHNGNGENGQHNVYRWNVPQLKGNCALRIRYNVSTGDAYGTDNRHDFWNIDASHNVDKSGIKLHNVYGFSTAEEAIARGYIYENNPEVSIFPGVKLRHNLAINTAQFGRTFQDRSFVFTVRDRQSFNIPSQAVVNNINVRGKRGNIVQVYPSVEYDFVPNVARIDQSDYVHFQWTGSNSNPGKNAGQGRAGSDRSNVIAIAPEVYKESSSNPPQYANNLPIVGDWGRNYPAFLKNNSFLGFTENDRMNLALLSNVQYGGDMFQLDDAGTYYDLGPKQVTQRGIFHYMSTRNNAFTNRCQKAKIVVP